MKGSRSVTITTIASTAPHILPNHVIGARCTTSAATNVRHTRRRLAPHLNAPNAMGHATGTVHKSPAPLHACGQSSRKDELLQRRQAGEALGQSCRASVADLVVSAAGDKKRVK